MALSEAQADRARYIRTVLSHHDHTQADLARLLGISQPAANRKLKGLRRFTDDELLQVAEAYELDPGNLLRPPELSGVLGRVSKRLADLLTCTKYQLRLVCARPRTRYGHSAKSAVIRTLRFA